VAAAGGAGRKHECFPVDEESDSAVNPVIAKALKRFKLAEDAEEDIRTKSLKDLRFRAGEQWPEDIQQTRVLDKRPCLNINRLPQFIRQVTNDQRQNRPSLRFTATDESTVDTAEIMEGLARHIQSASNADIAFDTACEMQVTIGFGYFMVDTEYCDDNGFDQEIKIKRIKNPFTVYFDPDAREPDYSDAKWAFIVSDVSKDELKGQSELSYSDISLSSVGDQAPGWIQDTRVRIAEYWEVEETERTVYLLADGTLTEEKPKDKNLIAKKRQAIDRKVIWRKITAMEVLDEREWPGRYIPIVPVLGDDLDIDGKRRLTGMVRDAQDPMRMYNYWSPLALDTPIPTPSGWTTMGEIKVGDQVFDERGEICDVLGESPVHINRECLKITFDDDSIIVADKEHPWVVEERGNRKTITWDWKKKKITTGELTPGKHFIWSSKPLVTKEKELPVHPYLLGVWLGDGCTAVPRISQGKDDLQDLRGELSDLGFDLGKSYIDASGHGHFTVLGMTEAFLAAGVLGRKHIPSDYLRASYEQRLFLLQGLMDTDGSICTKTKTCEYTTILPELRDGLIELLRSMGIKAKVLYRNRKIAVFGDRSYKTAEAYQFNFTCPELPIFRLKRKKEMQADKKNYHPRRTKRYGIKSVESVTSVPVKCIGVSSKSHLFLAGEAMIPTHNSAITEAIALAPRAPFIAAEGQIENYKALWESANTRNWSHLPYRPVALNGALVPAPMRNQAEPPIMAMQQALAGADRDLMHTTGIYQAGLGQKSNETSGLAIQKRQHEGDVANFHYIDNLSRAIRFLGVILLDLIPKIYDTARVIRILHENNEAEVVKINQIFSHKGKTVNYDMTVAKYDVSVQVGPSFDTKRQESADAMSTVLQANPQLWNVIGDLAVQNMDWPGAQQMAERLKKMLPPPLQENPNGQPPLPPQVQAQLQHSQQMIQQLTQALNEAQDKIDAKQQDIESRERIAAQNNETNLAIAALRMEGANNLGLLKEELTHIRERLAMLHANVPMENETAEPPQGQTLPAS